jgi:hypothetical protein
MTVLRVSGGGTASKELGLQECAAHREHVFLPDAIRAPVFAQQLANLDRRQTKRAKRINDNVSRAYRTGRRAIKKLLKGIRAIPTVPGGGGGVHGGREFRRGGSSSCGSSS